MSRICRICKEMKREDEWDTRSPCSLCQEEQIQNKLHLEDNEAFSWEIPEEKEEFERHPPLD